MRAAESGKAAVWCLSICPVHGLMPPMRGIGCALSLRRLMHDGGGAKYRPINCAKDADAARSSSRRTFRTVYKHCQFARHAFEC